MHAKTALLFSCVLLQGCLKSEPLQNDNSAPFTIYGFTLGNHVSSSFKDDHPELHCKTEKKDVLSCFGTMTGSNQGFFSRKLESVSIKVNLSSLRISEISAEIDLDGERELGKLDLEQTWRIQGRCLTSSDYDAAVSYDEEKTRYFDKMLTEALLYPSDSDFICLSKDGHLLQYDGRPDQKKRWVEVFYLKDEYVTAFKYIFDAYNEYKAANGIS